MKSLIVVFLLSSSFMLAQSEALDSCATEMYQDSICISDLVQKQIEAAREKQNHPVVPEVSEAVVNIAPKIIAAPVSNDPVKKFVKSLPLQVIIFITASFIVIVVLVVRRLIHSIKKNSSRTLKNRIASLREEKVVATVNAKLKDERKKLRNRKSILDASEKQISNLAKELNIAKGELLLASRLKLFEIGKM